MMKKLFSIIILVVCWGCEPETGIIKDKIIVPEHTETINTFIPTVGLGFDGQIHTIMMPTTQEITVPDKYYIVIGNARRQFNVRVDKTEYDSYTIGDHYPHYEKP